VVNNVVADSKSSGKNSQYELLIENDQRLPSTARRFNLTNPYDPAQNLLAGRSICEIPNLLNGKKHLILAAFKEALRPRVIAT